jgi:hypothetical protein
MKWSEKSRNALEHSMKSDNGRIQFPSKAVFSKSSAKITKSRFSLDHIQRADALRDG